MFGGSSPRSPCADSCRSVGAVAGHHPWRVEPPYPSQCFVEGVAGQTRSSAAHPRFARVLLMAESLSTISGIAALGLVCELLAVRLRLVVVAIASIDAPARRSLFEPVEHMLRLTSSIISTRCGAALEETCLSSTYVFLVHEHASVAISDRASVQR